MACELYLSQLMKTSELDLKKDLLLGSGRARTGRKAKTPCQGGGNSQGAPGQQTHTNETTCEQIQNNRSLILMQINKDVGNSIRQIIGIVKCISIQL